AEIGGACAGLKGNPVDAVVPAFLAELLELALDLAFDTHFLGDAFEEGQKLRPTQIALDVELLGDAIVSRDAEHPDPRLAREVLEDFEVVFRRRRAHRGDAHKRGPR